MTLSIYLPRGARTLGRKTIFRNGVHRERRVTAEEERRMKHRVSVPTLLLVGSLVWMGPTLISAQTTGGTGSTPPTVRPGAPGSPSRTLTAAEAGQVSLPRHTPADVRFMQDMMHHHLQAVEMASLVVARTENLDLRLLARKIEASQADELLTMRNWLVARGETSPWEPTPPADDAAAHAGHTAQAGTVAQVAQGSHAGLAGHVGHEGMTMDAPMPGMLTEAQLDELREVRGLAFDQMFLAFMIFHHLGAIEMVQALFATPGGGQEGEVYQFAAHVDSDQKIEIERMRRVLSSLGSDPDGR